MLLFDKLKRQLMERMHTRAAPEFPFKTRANTRQSRSYYDNTQKIREKQTCHWLKRNIRVTYKQYIKHLNEVYKQPEQVEIFGKVKFR